MRIGNLAGRSVLFTERGATDVAEVSDGRFSPDPQMVFEHWDDFREWAARLDPRSPARSYDVDELQAPVPRPGQLFAIGLNYRDHAAEAGLGLPDSPTVFTKFRASITGPTGEIVLAGDTVDWEAELVVVIGRTARHVPVEQGWDHVAGLTVGQDVSERTVQGAGPAPQFSLGKSFPGFTPMGPWLVTVDEVRAAGLDPDALDIGADVNGEPVQKGTTADLVFSVPALVAELSAVLELSPGDVIFTGTPAGVGAGRTPPRFLAPGDELRTTIAGLGELRHRFVAATPAGKV